MYGRFREVKRECSKLVTQLRRGKPWAELGGEMIDTREHPGLLVLDGPSNLTGGDVNFNLFATAHAISYAIPRRLPHEAPNELFEPMLATHWGFVAMLGQWGRCFLFPPGHQAAFLHALARYWDDLDPDQPRFTNGSRSGDPLWQLPTNIQFCLAREGLAGELFERPVPPGGMAELVAQTRAGVSG